MKKLFIVFCVLLCDASCSHNFQTGYLNNYTITDTYKKCDEKGENCKLVQDILPLTGKR